MTTKRLKDLNLNELQDVYSRCSREVDYNILSGDKLNNKTVLVEEIKQYLLEIGDDPDEKIFTLGIDEKRKLRQKQENFKRRKAAISRIIDRERKLIGSPIHDYDFTSDKEKWRELIKWTLKEDTRLRLELKKKHSVKLNGSESIHELEKMLKVCQEKETPQASVMKIKEPHDTSSNKGEQSKNKAKKEEKQRKKMAQIEISQNQLNPLEANVSSSVIAENKEICCMVNSEMDAAACSNVGDSVHKKKEFIEPCVVKLRKDGQDSVQRTESQTFADSACGNSGHEGQEELVKTTANDAKAGMTDETGDDKAEVTEPRSLEVSKDLRMKLATESSNSFSPSRESVSTELQEGVLEAVQVMKSEVDLIKMNLKKVKTSFGQSRQVVLEAIKSMKDQIRKLQDEIVSFCYDKCASMCVGRP